MLEFQLGGINFYALRLFLLITIPLLLLSGRLKCYQNKVSKYTFFLMIIWLVYACLSVLWSIDRTAAFKDIFYLLFGLFTFIFLVSIKSGYSEFEERLSGIWTAVFIVVLLVSTWEINSGTHLVSSLTERLYHVKPFNKLNYVPVFTFDNPNYYATYACLSVVIFIGMILRSEKQVLSGFMIASCLFIVHLASARFGMITLLLFLLLSGVYRVLKSTKDELKAISISSAKFIGVLSLLLIGIFCFHSTENVHDKIITPADITPDDHLSSNLLRKNLILTGVQFFKDSKGLGVGAGNYKSLINNGMSEYDLDGMDAPHNWAIEILSQYGIIIALLIFALFIFILFVLYRSVKQTGFRKQHLILICLITCYVIMSNANSTFISLPLNWFMFSLIALNSDGLLENNIADARKN